MNAASRQSKISQAVDNARRGTSCLIYIPPGCDGRPEMVHLIRKALEEDADLRQRFAYVSSDTLSSERELVATLIDQWAHRDESIEPLWRPKAEEMAAADPKDILGRFFNLCVVQPRHAPRIALVKRFDRMFSYVRREFLSTLREWEEENQLVMLNSSPMVYDELLRRRPEILTSEYGRFQPTVPAGLLSEEEATEQWRNSRLPKRKRGAALLRVAIEISGLLPEAFHLAVNVAQMQPSISVEDYRQKLIDELSRTFTRLLGAEDEARKEELLRAVVNVFAGRDTFSDQRFLKNHTLRSLLIEGDRKIRLRSPLIGATARNELCMVGPDPLEPMELYRNGQYRNCCLLVEDAETAAERVLYLASRMFLEIFGDGGGHYFRAEADWNEIMACAEEAEDLCAAEEAKEEFRRWRVIAGAHVTAEDNAGANLTAIRLAVETVTLMNDGHVMRSHPAATLVEKVLKHFVENVLRLPLKGDPWSAVSDEYQGKWMPQNFPRSKTMVMTKGVAYLAAASSDASGRPLYATPDELMETLQTLEIRNEIVHGDSPSTDVLADRLVMHVQSLLDRVLEYSQASFRTDDVRRWMRPPSAFLPTR